MKEIGEALSYPMENDDWIVTTLIGGVLLFLGFLLLPLFVVYGYIVGVIRDSLTGHSEPSPFENWGTLFVEGLQAWIIGLIYMLIPLIVGAVTIGSSVLAMMTGTEAGAAIGFGALFGGFGLTLLLVLVFGYVAVAAVVNFAREERFGAAFEFDTLKLVLVHRDYAVAWLVSVVILFIASFVNMIPFLGWILAPFVVFYAAVVAADLWADGFVAALG